MPTGYTAGVQDGDITTLEEYALICVRAFAYYSRDAPAGPLRDPDPPNSDYYHEANERARVELAELASDAYASAAMRREAAERARINAEYAEKKAETRRRYLAMLDLVCEWQPPTTEHQGLRDFMESQLRESLEFDCPVVGYEMPEPPDTLPEWRLKRIAKLHDDIAYNTTQIQKENARYAHNLEWARALRTSLASAEVTA